MPKRLPSLNAELLPSIVESILFVAEEPVEVSLLARALRRPDQEVEGALAELEQRCLAGGTRLQRTGDLVQLVTDPESGPYVERFLGLESRQRLSGAALESLAIIAYKQPMTRAGVEQVRGVNSDGAIASLIARGLVEEVGKAPGPGRPALLGTTMRFLEHFGLSNPSDLPPLASAEMAGALGLEADDDEDGELLDEDEPEDEGAVATASE
ncbi:MAG TPA: SMC-Scp complex subunit ScpB [Dehalococcoidia bacterium]|jgi:segregation and condensation protein B|nr:SMC-Scp complex subunit ScpB [Dehalococcoidia bacterium]